MPTPSGWYPVCRPSSSLLNAPEPQTTATFPVGNNLLPQTNALGRQHHYQVPCGECVAELQPPENVRPSQTGILQIVAGLFFRNAKVMKYKGTQRNCFSSQEARRTQVTSVADPVWILSPGSRTLWRPPMRPAWGL